MGDIVDVYVLVNYFELVIFGIGYLIEQYWQSVGYYFEGFGYGVGNNRILIKCIGGVQ